MKKQKNKGGWLDKYQDEALPKAQNGIKESINKYLGDPYGEAREFAENPDELANIDNMRHAQATRLTQEAIANKTGNIPLISDTLGLLGSNALGVGHELKTLFGDKDKRDWSTKLQESGEDIFNNLFGSVIGTLPIDDKTKDDIIKYASYNNMLPDGYVRGEQGEEDGLSENVYFKNEDNEVRRPEYKNGVWLDKYQTGGIVSGASGMMYGRTSGNAPMEPGELKKAQTGDTYDWEKIRENSPSFLENFTEQTIEPIEEKPKSFYDSLLNDAVISSGGTIEDWEKLSGMISYHESKDDPLAKQKVKKTKDNPTGIGLGRGLYQFEPDSFKTAANRAYNYSKKTGLELPQFVKDIRSKKIKEASELTPDQQKTLLLADYRDKPTAKLKAFFSGDKDDQAIEDFWVTGHWSGGNKDEQERRTSFKKDASTYNNLYSKKKNGGWLDKYEDGGEIDKAQNGNFGGVNTDIRDTSGEPIYDIVNPDDPNYDAKYRETYNAGAFASMPNQLDEVVLNSGVDYEKYPLYDDLSEQDRQYFKDDGAIGRGVRRKAQTKKGLAEDTYDVVNPLMYGMLGVAGGMMAGPSIANLSRAAAPYVVSTARTIGNSPVGVGIKKALNYKPMGGPASLGNMMDVGFADMALRDTPEMYDAFKENPNWDTGTDLALTASDLIPYGEIATGFKGTRRLINSAANKFNDLTSLKPNFTPIERVVENEAGRLKNLFNQPNIYPTSSPLPKRMEPYLSQREIPISKEEELLQSTFDWNDPEKLKHYNDELESRLIRYNQKGEVIPKQKQGGVIKDDMGQWAHPGEVTEISGNTMATHGYGDNPLYVVPDVGEPRVVQANTGTQTFPGATKFTEYPMAKNGSYLVELNQLTNFTNYNTPQPGGWLDKY